MIYGVLVQRCLGQNPKDAHMLGSEATIHQPLGEGTGLGVGRRPTVHVCMYVPVVCEGVKDHS